MFKISFWMIVGMVAADFYGRGEISGIWALMLLGFILREMMNVLYDFVKEEERKERKYGKQNCGN